MTFLQFVPFFILVVLANHAERQQVVKYIVYGLLVLIDGTCLLGSALLAGIYLLLPYVDWGGPLPLNVDFLGTALLLFFTAVLGIAVILGPVRRWLARWIPINPASPLHATALAMGVYYTGFSILPILLVGGLEGLGSLPLGVSTVDILISGLSVMLFGILGVGFLMRRTGAETLKRLGLVLPKASHLGLAVAAVLGFLALDLSVTWLWHLLDPEGYTLVGRVSLGLFGDITIWKVLAIALSAGIGEEILFRGAVHPRFGLWLTAALFAAGHTQYGFSPAILEVFVVGVILGLIRNRANTTTCILVHVLYNLLDLLLVPLFP